MSAFYYLKYYYYFLQSQFVGYPFVIRLTVFLVLIFIFLYILSVVRSLLLNRKERHRNSFYERLKKDLDWKLEEVFYSTKNFNDQKLAEFFEGDINLVRKTWHKKVFTEYIINFVEQFQNTKEINTINYQGVLSVFNVLEFWSKRVVANSSKKRRVALRSLEDLNIGLTGATIMRSTYHKNPSLRKHARATMIKHDKNNPYQFLENDFDKNFNRLDEIRLHYFFNEKHAENNLPQLIRWVKLTDNIHFKRFLLSEIGFFEQKDAAPLLYDMLKSDHEEDAVKCSLIETLGKLSYVEAEDYLIKNFEFYGRELQLSTVKALSALQTATALDFLTQTYFLAEDYTLKIQIVQEISSFGEKGMQALHRMNQQAVLDFDKKVFNQYSYLAG